MADIIQIRRGTAAQWITTNPILADGELGFETDTKKGKLGNGVGAWITLPYSWTGEVFIDSLNNATTKTTPVDGDKIAISDSAAGNILKSLNWLNLKATLKTYFDTLYSNATGTVTSVAATVPTGFSVAGSPITTTGTLAISFAAGYSLPTDANQTNWGTAYTHSQLVTGSVHGSTAVGEALLRLANPSAIRFLRLNADNTATALTAADFLTAIGAASSSHTHNASEIVAGTFASGNFVFPSNLDINGQTASPAHAKGNITGATTVDFNDGNIQTMTLIGNVTFTFSNPKSGASYQLFITNDGTVRTVVWPTIKWKGGTAPTFTGTLNKIDIITLTYDGVAYSAVFSLNH